MMNRRLRKKLAILDAIGGAVHTSYMVRLVLVNNFSTLSPLSVVQQDNGGIDV